MTGIKSIDWVLKKLASAKQTSKGQWQSLTGRMNAVLGKSVGSPIEKIEEKNETPNREGQAHVESQTEAVLQAVTEQPVMTSSETKEAAAAVLAERNEEQPLAAAENPNESQPLVMDSTETNAAEQPSLITADGSKESEQQAVRMDWFSVLRGYRMQLVKGAGALGLIGCITFGGNHYVQANTHEVYHVLFNGQDIGTVSSPQLVDDFKIEKYKELGKKYPDVQMVLNTDEVLIRSEKAFNLEYDNEAALKALSAKLSAHAVGVQLSIDGKAVGVLKDQKTADTVLDTIKGKYVPQKDKNVGEVAALSTKNLAPGESELQEAGFVQKVELTPVNVQPEELADPQKVIEKLQTGDVKPNVYTVQEGDCLGCIAKKFNITKQAIYQNNPGVTDDFIKVGQQLNLTILKPALSVKTVEKMVETQEVQYDTEVIQDPAMKAGEVQPVQDGKNGVKKVAFKVTKVDGLMADEELESEEVVTPPVKAVVRKGTKVVLGEGSGKFAYPVVSFTMTSGFGQRWGKLHKGVDLVSGNKNILAADNGKVVFAGYRNDYGNCVIIDHANGYRTLYGHMSQLYTTVGKIVEKGEKIGYMGSTGDSTGVHLHFEIQRNGNVENPLKYLSR
ncbi:M23 family metallopeptidase [Paenibacillus aurantius]|uniref:M23 family metallopeptidase n=1 Tax=Paenibacillus aurantius TaxID=2918900 RepID=A0AA96LE19_9BACL|nr:M23 family metallopeptidase [Paenibacillus aurantius]WNQ11479.1 M23 family metallopeptidase [Paenibacillus aurantius]